MLKKKVLFSVLLFSMTAYFICGCGILSGIKNIAAKETPTPEGTVNESPEPDFEPTPEEDVEPISEDEKEYSKMLGDWEYIATISKSDDSEGGTYEYECLVTEDFSPTSSITIRDDDGVYRADYMYSEECYETMFYGAELEYLKEPAYETADNQSWCMLMKNPLVEEDKDTNNVRKISLTDDDRLVVSRVYKSEYDDGTYYRSTEEDIYLRKDSPVLKDKENLGYFETVTVHNAEELLSNIKSNTKIILESGDYNFSNVDPGKINNRYVDFYTDYFLTVRNVYYLCLEAKDGEDVLLSVDDPYSPVLGFVDSKNVVVKNITAGHNVEPGYCSGSVLYFEGGQNFKVEGCNLFGSGTYGIEAYNAYTIDVDRTNIYECTYGLIYLTQCGTCNFRNCRLTDSMEYAMIEVHGNYEINFTNCEFTNNDSTSYDAVSFVELNEDDKVKFSNCKFKNNKYYNFSNYEVVLENCIFDNVQE